MASTNNQFRQYYFDVTDIVRSCDNSVLSINFGSATVIANATAALPGQESTQNPALSLNIVVNSIQPGRGQSRGCLSFRTDSLFARNKMILDGTGALLSRRRDPGSPHMLFN